VLPFRVIEEPGAGDHYRTCVPLVSLKAAAGYWSEEQTDLEGFASQANEWIAFETGTAFEDGMFVARVRGKSMEPEIPDNSYCLFRQPRGGSRQGRRVLVRHAGLTDPETGGEFTVKVFSSEKSGNGDGGWRHEKIVLKPLNPDFEPIELTPESEDEVRVIAEFVEVVGAAAPVEV
jgi:phage repressor protein C with HTH and peptisase S24 domain